MIHIRCVIKHKIQKYSSADDSVESALDAVGDAAKLAHDVLLDGAQLTELLLISVKVGAQLVQLIERDRALLRQLTGILETSLLCVHYLLYLVRVVHLFFWRHYRHV